jgi:hypothetical protein
MSHCITVIKEQEMITESCMQTLRSEMVFLKGSKSCSTKKEHIDGKQIQPSRMPRFRA